MVEWYVGKILDYINYMVGFLVGDDLCHIIELVGLVQAFCLYDHALRFCCGFCEVGVVITMIYLRMNNSNQHLDVH